MKLNYYIKQPTDKRGCLIYIQIRHEGKKIVISTKQWVADNIWDRDRQRVGVAQATEQNGFIYLNQNLDRIEKEYDVLFLKMSNEGTLSKYNFRDDLLYTGLKRIIQFKNPADRALMAEYSKRRVGSLHPSYVIQRLKRDGFTTQEAKRHPVLQELKKMQIITKRTLKHMQNDNRD